MKETHSIYFKDTPLHIKLRTHTHTHFILYANDLWELSLLVFKLQSWHNEARKMYEWNAQQSDKRNVKNASFRREREKKATTTGNCSICGRKKYIWLYWTGNWCCRRIKRWNGSAWSSMKINWIEWTQLINTEWFLLLALSHSLNRIRSMKTTLKHYILTSWYTYNLNVSSWVQSFLL